MPVEEVHHEVSSWLMGLDTDFLCSGMGNPVKRWHKCLNKYGDYVEKQLKYTRFFLCILTLLIKRFLKEKMLPYFSDNPRIYRLKNRFQNLNYKYK
jgi:hypothetical protein